MRDRFKQITIYALIIYIFHLQGKSLNFLICVGALYATLELIDLLLIIYKWKLNREFKKLKEEERELMRRGDA